MPTHHSTTSRKLLGGVLFGLPAGPEDVLHLPGDLHCGRVHGWHNDGGVGSGALEYAGLLHALAQLSPEILLLLQLALELLPLQDLLLLAEVVAPPEKGKKVFLLLVRV